MKVTILVLFLLMAMTFAQTPRPVPLPSLNLTKVQGLWYAVAAYPSSSNIGITCFTMNVTVLSGTSINVTVAEEAYGNSYSIVVPMNVSNNGSIWTSPTQVPAAWISFDPVNGTWGTFASYGSQDALILSRSKALNTSIIVSQLALLQAEGYQATMSNTYFLPNNCTKREFV